MSDLEKAREAARQLINKFAEFFELERTTGQPHVEQGIAAWGLLQRAEEAELAQSKSYVSDPYTHQKRAADLRRQAGESDA